MILVVFNKVVSGGGVVDLDGLRIGCACVVGSREWSCGGG